MRDPRRRVVVFALAALAAAGSACNREEERKAEAARQEAAAREAQRAIKLVESLKAFAPAASDADARKDFATMRDHSPATSHADIAQVERCQLEQIASAVKAAGDKRFQDAAAPLVDCLISMETLRNRVRREQLSAVLLNQNATGAVEREIKIRGALLEMVAGTLQVSAQLLGLILDYGPPEARLSTFEAVAQTLAPTGGGGESARALLQRGYASETVKDAKDKMAARLKALGVPLQPDSASAPAAPPAQP